MKRVSRRRVVVFACGLVAGVLGAGVGYRFGVRVDDGARVSPTETRAIARREAAPARAIPEGFTRPEPPRSLAAVRASRGHAEREYSLREYIRSRRAEDMSACLDEYLESSGYWARTEAVGRIFEHWGALDPVAAAAALGRLAAHERSSAVSSLLVGWTRHDPEAAWTWLRAEIDKDPRMETNAALVVGEVARRDPTRALAAAAELRSDAARDTAEMQIGAVVLEREGVAGLASLSRETFPEHARASAVRLGFERLAKQNMESALANLRMIDDPELARRATDGILAVWRGEDPVGAAEFVIERSDLDVSESTFHWLVSEAVSASDDEGALRILARANEVGRLERLAEQLLPHLAMVVGGETAMGAVAGLSSPEQRVSVGRSVLAAWGYTDLDSMVEWYDVRATDAQRRDYFGAASEVVMRGPDGLERVADWTARLPEPDRRIRVERLLVDLALVRGGSALDSRGRAALERMLAATPGLTEQGRRAAMVLLGSQPSP
ncbi:hypothetical protein ASA1KI_12270 [Opitutales bacterium ASA1]|uniref:hypothetical protein n=1 Tax=Congregicoccus parvus TaxID=3081749 RepID=UPI002B2D53B1|nr:hypothetical protein ASA1KI_12270 [Opitutales bacterium ASA1]